MEYNISEAELPTMVVRYENKLILRSVITGQHLEDLGFAPVWDDVAITPALRARRQRAEAAHDVALEALVRLYPCDELVAPPPPPPQPQLPPKPQSPQKKPTPVPLVAARAPSPLPINEAELPPCKVHRNYCCNYCNFCTQNPRSHLLHQRQVHGIRLSIHCCQHCQYASRYFQKLKRHVKMVHMDSSPGKLKVRSKSAVRKAPASEVTQLMNVAPQPERSNPATVKLTQPAEPANLPTQANQKSSLLPPQQTVAVGCPIAPTMPSEVCKNPEAFFEVAYRNQLIQQQQQEQRFKEFVKLSNELNKVHERETRQAPITTTTTPTKTTRINPTMTPLNVEKITSPTSSSSPKLPTEATTPESELKRIYSCRKCSYVTHIKSRYNKHVKYHSMPMIQCDKCEFRTTYKWNLTRHLRSHHGNGLYKCSVCSFSAQMKQSLTSHELNHHSPPVGHVSSVHKKPFCRRRCRVGGSDLVQDMRALHNPPNILARSRPLPITADNLENSTNLSSTVYHESLKLVIKREAGTSSYSSTPKIKSTEGVSKSPIEILGSKKSSSASESSTSSYSASPSSSCSNPDNAFRNFEPNGGTSTIAPPEIPSLPAQTTSAEAPKFPYTLLPVPALYSTSDDSESGSEDSDDSYSTVSANETVPHGLHIAYDSSSSELKSNLSNSPTTSDCSTKLQINELSQPSDFQENLTTLEN